jgi:pimeloyl-ACP methyl ester carboxylesterase
LNGRATFLEERDSHDVRPNPLCRLVSRHGAGSPSLRRPPAKAAKAAPVAPYVRKIARGDHKIAFQVIPGHRGTIVFDAGAGEDSTHWSKLAPEVARLTGFTVITYDRAGYGASDDVTGPLDLKAAVADLANGLQALGATHNVILVSHSFGGEIATYITAEKPQWFAGAVLVDANVPDYFTDAAIAFAQKLYAPVIAKARQDPSDRGNRGFLALSDSFEETTRAFHKAEWPASVPVVVIVSEKTPVPAGEPAQWWRDAEAQFAKRAANRTLVTAARSSHNVTHDRPDVVIKAIESIAARIH